MVKNRVGFHWKIVANFHGMETRHLRCPPCVHDRHGSGESDNYKCFAIDTLKVIPWSALTSGQTLPPC